MSGIVCALRGGPQSQPTIDRAIRLSKDTDQPLFFLYVVNLDFLEHTASSRVHAISQELQQMGEFILLAAQENAAAKGVQAQGLVRHGNVSEEIAAYCHELEAEYLVIGRPRLQHEESLFTDAQLQVFIQRIEDQTGARVVLPQEYEA
jgi:nucleotide-binding universal stress UspA family protein